MKNSMQWINTPDRYGAVTKLFHWVVFLLFVSQFTLAWLMPGEEEHHESHGPGAQPSSITNHSADESSEWDVRETHKSVGLLVLVLVLFRVTWRITTRLPEWAETLSARERRFTKILERLLYLAMLIMPSSGITMVFSEGDGIRFLNLVDIPPVIGPHETIATVAHLVHVWTARLILVLVAIHIGSILQHQFVRKDGLLRRMWPRVTKPELPSR